MNNGKIGSFSRRALTRTSLRISQGSGLDCLNYDMQLLLKRFGKMRILIDVRTPEEYEQGHLQDAIRINHNEILLHISSIAINKETPISLYCHSGKRSELAKHILLAAGYENVENLGGYEALKLIGYI